MSQPLSLFPARIRFVNSDGTLTPEAYRSLQTLLVRVGGPIAPNIGDLVASIDGLASAPEPVDFQIMAALDGVASRPVAIHPQAEEFAPPPFEPTPQIESLLSEVAALREAVARMTTQINDLNQRAEL